MINNFKNKIVNLKSILESLEISDTEETNDNVFIQANNKLDSIYMITLRDILDDPNFSSRRLKLNDFEKNIIETIKNDTSGACDNLYAVYSLDELSSIIDKAKQLFGEDGNYNWINVSGMRSLAGAFANNEIFNGDITRWDTSHVVNMLKTFQNCKKFNRDLTGWNLDSVKYINAATFAGCCEDFVKQFKNRYIPNKITNFS